MDQRYYQALGLRVWTPRHPTACLQEKETLQINSSTSTWETLQNQVKTCTACALHSTRTNTVFGVGNPQAELMIIGEAPGFNEDQQGEPFVGRAGQLLTAMIKSLGLTREQVFIANILKCRPPNNRDPQVIEVQTCTPFLNQQIAYIKPKLLLAVGRIAAHYLLQTKSSLESLRGKLHAYGNENIPLIVTYHPAYLLRSPGDKKKAFLDLQFVMENLSPLPERFLRGERELYRDYFIQRL